MKILPCILLVMLSLLFWGCKKYLSEAPLVQADIETADQLDALLNNATAYTYETDYTAGYSSDDTELPPTDYQNYPSAFNVSFLYYYTQNTDLFISNLSADALWSGEYTKIFNANLVLASVNKVTGADSVKNRLTADAHFVRAYSYWVLANHYCLPYTKENESTLGLPLKTSTDYTQSLKRSTLKETYDFIMAELAQARQISTNDVNPLLPWRPSQRAIDAFLSRYYLFLGQYDSCINYANRALATQTAALVDYKTAITAGTSASYTNPAATLKYSILNTWTAAKFLYWGEFYYTRFSYVATQWWMPSSALLSLYDTTNDLRYKWFMIPNGGRRFSVITPSMYRYSMFNDGRYTPSGPTVAEVLLNKAEALARTGNIADALSAVNTLRLKRMSTYSALAAVNQDSAIVKILQERRRELPFSMRWYDIRRFSVNNYPADDITVQRNFFKIAADGTVDVTTPQVYTLPTGGKRYAVPIIAVEINASQGQIEQNSY